MVTCSKSPVLRTCEYLICHIRNIIIINQILFSADVDFGKLCFRPEDQHSRYMVVARQDKTGKRHQILYDEKFIKILNEAEQRKSIESESEVEDLHAISDEEAEDQRWEEWMKDKRIKSSSI